MKQGHETTQTAIQTCHGENFPLNRSADCSMWIVPPTINGHLVQNLLDLQFSAAKSDEKWLTDVTEFKWYEGVEVDKLYLSAVRDVYDRLRMPIKGSTAYNYQRVQIKTGEAAPLLCNPLSPIQGPLSLYRLYNLGLFRHSGHGGRFLNPKVW